MADERAGRLAASVLGTLVTGDPGRLSRGRTYARQGAVEHLAVDPGLVVADVQGSRPAPYHVQIRVAEADAFDTVNALVPSRREVRFNCTCPDDSDPCKHAVAVMVAFTSLVEDDIELLARWRGKPAPGSGPRAVVGSRLHGTATAAAGSGSAVGGWAGLGAEAVAALVGFLGTPQVIDLGPVSRLAPPVAAWGELWAEMLDDALEVLEIELDDASLTDP